MKTRNETVEGVALTRRSTLADLLKRGDLADLEEVARITGYCVRYLRRLCHERAVDHHRLLGRYYMTPGEVSALIKPVRARREAGATD